MSFWEIYLAALAVIIALMTVLWLVSIFLNNVSIVDIFWGFGFVVASLIYFLLSDGNELRRTIVFILVTIWGLRLTAYLAWRNSGKGEDFRYREFRLRYGEKRYWWISYFQTFLLQGTLMWLISAPLLGAMHFGGDRQFSYTDLAAIVVWLTGFVFEAGGDMQLALFKANPQNKGKLLDKGFWKFTRHPNYFGDSAVWWGYGLFCIGAGSLVPVLGSLLMTALIIKISGVALLEKSLKVQKPGYEDYVRRTSAFFPWFPSKR